MSFRSLGKLAAALWQLSRRLRPRRYGLLYVLLVPVAVAFTLGFGGVVVLQNGVISDQQGVALMAYGNTRLSALLDRLTSRREIRETLVTMFAADPGVIAAVSAGDVGGLAAQLVALKARLGLPAVTVLDAEGEELAALGAQGLDSPNDSVTSRGLIGLTESHFQVSSSGLTAFSVSPIKGPTGIVGIMIFAEAWGMGELGSLGSSETIELALYQANQLVVKSSEDLPFVTDLAQLGTDGEPAAIGPHAMNSMLLVTRPLADGLVLTAGVPIGAAQRVLDQQNAMRAIALVATFALLAIVMWGVARSLTSTIRQVAIATVDISLGNHATRIVPGAITELFHLSSGINSMASDLERHEAVAQSQQHQLEALNMDLATTNLDLQGRTREAEQASRAKSQFLANMSHELRTPLNAVIGFADILQAEMVGPLNEEQKDLLAEVSGAGKHLLTLVSDVLDIARIEAGKLVVDLVPCSLADVMEESLRVVRPLAAAKVQELTATVRPDMVDVLGDPVRLKQMTLNLLSNAIKFTPVDGKVQVAVGVQNGIAWLSVADSGPGIPKELQATIFDKFERVERRGERTLNEGTGLGLALTRQLAELQGGEVGCESMPGKGSYFWFTVPLEQSAGIASHDTQQREVAA